MKPRSKPVLNPVLAPLFARRSVRKFAARPLGEAQIADLLEAAMSAPSACAADPWHFIVLLDRDLRQRVAEVLPYGKMLAPAGAGIIVCGDLEQTHDRELSFLLQDCSAAIENLLLAASMMGLGAVWLGVHPRQERIDRIRALFDLPSHIIPVGAVAVGWPAERPAPRTRYRAPAVHVDAW